jgi:hypothetical protein
MCREHERAYLTGDSPTLWAGAVETEDGPVQRAAEDRDFVIDEKT